MGRPRAYFTILLSISLSVAGFLGGCGSGEGSSDEAEKDASSAVDGPSPSDGPTFSSSDSTFSMIFGNYDAGASDGGSAALTSLTIAPQNAEIDVSIVNGQVASV